MSEKPELSAVQQWILQAQREILSRNGARQDDRCRPELPTAQEEEQTAANNTAA